jgi:hypothetical protein
MWFVGVLILDRSLPDGMQVYGSNRRNENLVRLIRLLDFSPRARNLPVSRTLVDRSLSFAISTEKEGKLRHFRFAATLLHFCSKPTCPQTIDPSLMRRYVLVPYPRLAMIGNRGSIAKSPSQGKKAKKTYSRRFRQWMSMNSILAVRGQCACDSKHVLTDMQKTCS